MNPTDETQTNADAPAPISPAAGNTGDAGARKPFEVKVEQSQFPGWWKVFISVPDGRLNPIPEYDIPMSRVGQIIFDGENAEGSARDAASQLQWALAPLAASLATSEAARETYRLRAEGAERERDAAKAEAAGMRTAAELLRELYDDGWTGRSRGHVPSRVDRRTRRVRLSDARQPEPD
jgi:hypothetical protein